ncbi:MspI family type II restriction endonuclease [Facklamia sp. P13055]|uniref:MspI family type II restriction endonuclease n=1 Tax=unclassified Facklamia TaxID=2622293 RepID=UPI003D162EBC
MFVNENLMKYKSGQSVKELIYNVIEPICDDPNFNVEFSSNYNIGYPNKEKQFKMDFKVVFSEFNNETWLIKGTSSVRNDRIYGNEYMAQNIRLINDNITKIFLVVPDSISEKEMQNAKRYSEKIKSETYVSFITDVITVNQLARKIVTKTTEKMPQGQRANVLGSISENSAVLFFKDPKNIELWNDYTNASRTIKSSTYILFKTVLLAIGLTEGVDTIKNIEASSDIPRLSNNGLPKTDLTVCIEMSNGQKLVRNISIKNSTAKEVTIHEGNIADLISALDIDHESSIANALLKFEKVGSRKRLLETHPNSINILDSNLSEYNEQLLKFFIFGDNNPLVNDPVQIADMIIFTHKFEVFKKDEYISYYLEKYSHSGQFGTPFKWTYPSKKRGKKFQIKGFTNND